MPTTQDIEAGIRPSGIGNPSVLQLDLGGPPRPLNLEEAQNFAVYDQARQDEAAANWTQQRTMSEAPQVVDRQAYLTQQQEARQQILQQAQRGQQVAAPLTNAINLYSRIAAQPDLSQPQASSLPEATQQFPRPQRGGPTIGGALEGAYNVARTEIPYADRAANVAGQLGQFIGKHALPAVFGLPPGAENLPGISQVTDITGKAGEVIASSFVPQEVWQVALMLLPAAKARSIPELLSAITLGDTDALSALRNAGKRLGQSERVDQFIGKLGSEAGFAKIPGEAGGEAEKLGLGAPAEVAPAFDASGRPIEMKSGEPYAQFDEHGNPVDPATGQPLNDKSVIARLNAQPTPADHAALQINEWLRTGAKARPEQRVMFAQQRAQRGAKMEAVYQRGGTSAEAMAAAGGEFKRPFLAPLELTPEGEQGLRQEIRTSTVMGYPANKNSAEKAIDAMQAGVLPQPDHAIQLSKIIGGPDFLMMLDKRAPIEWKKEFMGVLGIPKGMQSGWDLSAVFRKMAPLGFGNWAEYIDAIGTIGRAAHSIESARAVQAETEAIPWVTEGANAEAEALGINFRNLGGRMADIGIHLYESEGQFSSINQSLASKAIEKLPGYQMSERVFNVPLNRERGLVFSKFAQNMWDSGERDVGRYKAVADVIDHASGWSEHKIAEIGKGFNAFYSARNFVARFQVLLDPILQPGSLFQPSARQLAARNLVGFVSANAAMLGLLAGSGAIAGKALGIPNPVHVGLDPRSPDGFKGLIGNTRIDMTAGFGPIIRLVAQLSPVALSPYTLATEGKWSNPRVTSVSGITRNASAVDLVNNFFASKQDPIFHMLWGAMKFPGGQAYQEDFRSMPGARTAMFHLFTPFFVQDVVEAWRVEGKNNALLAAPVSFLGGGVNTYAQSEVSKAADLKMGALSAVEKAGFDPNAVWKQAEGQKALQVSAGDDPAKYGSFDEYRKAYIDARTPQIASEKKFTTARAQQAAREEFDGSAVVKTYHAAVIQTEWAFWSNPANKALAQQASDSGFRQFTPKQRLQLGIK